MISQKTTEEIREQNILTGRWDGGNWRCVFWLRSSGAPATPCRTIRAPHLFVVKPRINPTYLSSEQQLTRCYRHVTLLDPMFCKTPATSIASDIYKRTKHQFFLLSRHFWRPTLTVLYVYTFHFCPICILTITQFWYTYMYITIILINQHMCMYIWRMTE